MRSRRRLLRSLVHLLSLLLMLAHPEGSRTSDMGGGGYGGSPGPQSQVPSDEVIPGVVVVKLKRTGPLPDGTRAGSTVKVEGGLARAGVTVLERAFRVAATLSDDEIAAGKVDISRIHYATIPADANPVEIAAQLSHLPEVEYAEPQYYHHLAEAPNDSDYAAMQQAYFDRMRVAAGWTLQKGTPEVIIAAVDGGTNWRHPDLAANIWVNPGEDLNHDGKYTPIRSPAGDLNEKDDDGNGKVDDVIGWNFGKKTNDPQGFLSVNADHGTETASGFGAVTNNVIGMAGTSWNCRIMPVCVSDSRVDVSVRYGFDGIVYAVLEGARVINCSWYRAGGSGNFSQYEQEVITWAAEHGALVVAAAGNNHLQNLDIDPYYPASYDHVLSVGATQNGSDEIAPFTDIGLSVSTFAPGVGIRVAKDDGSLGMATGTSHAAPLVAGLAGLLFAAHPDWAPEQVAAQIRITSDPIDAENPAYAGSLGHGRVNFHRALSEVHSGIVFRNHRFSSPSGQRFFLAGDSVLLSVALKNVLTAAAENLQFTVTADASLEPLALVHAPARLAPGAIDSLIYLFTVGDVKQKQDARVKVGWRANGNEQDARLFHTTVYAREGYWERQMSPTQSALQCVYPVDSKTVWASGWKWGELRSAIVRTTDGGDNWHLMSTPSFFWAHCITATDSLHAWVNGAFGSAYNSGHILFTEDGGKSWQRQTYPDPQASHFSGFWFFDADNGYAFGNPTTSTGGRYVILRTTDGGANWTHMANEPGGIGGKDITPNAIWCTDEDHIWFGTQDGRIWYTSDGGESWSSIPISKSRVNDLVMRDDSVGVLTAGLDWAFEELLLLRTWNGWRTWDTLATVIPGNVHAVAFPKGSTDVWIAGDGGVAHSRDEGTTWTPQPSDPFSISVYAMSFSDPVHGWMVTDQGQILRYHSVIPVVSVQREPSLPSQAMLEQNYPNPFNPKTTVRFQVPGTSEVKLHVYDILGRAVAVLVDERKPAGVYEVRFDGSALASGVYFYRLLVHSLDSRGGADFVQTRKLCLVK